MRNGNVFTPRSARKLVNGSMIEPIAFCMNSNCSFSRALFPISTTPPTASEWPLMYLVTECTTMSKPSSSGRCS